ncbi:MAG: hypothetical protein IJ186_00940 [Bacilli bacterium]|nr:hypothetical protein [Bacilli bacterium]
MRKNRILAILMPIFLLSLSSCVLYNGKGKPNKGDDSGDHTPGGDDTPTPTPGPGGDDTPTPTPGPGGEDVPSGTEVTTYLVLGKYGLYQGSQGTSIDSLFLENTVEYKAVVGSALPGVEEVTSSIGGSVFQYWQAYDGTGAPVGYTRVPSVANKILYAVFSGGEGGSTSEAPEEGYGIMFGSGKYYLATHSSDPVYDGVQYAEYTINNVDFKKDETFGLYDFGTQAQWTVNLDPYSFGGSPDSIKWTSYLSKGESSYTVLKDFTASYFCIKLAFEKDQVYIGIPAEA